MQLNLNNHNSYLYVHEYVSVRNSQVAQSWKNGDIISHFAFLCLFLTDKKVRFLTDKTKFSNALKMLTGVFHESTLSQKMVAHDKSLSQKIKMLNSILTTDENVETLKKILMENRPISVRKIGENVAISFSSCQFFWMH